VYTNNDPWNSFSYCNPIHPSSQIIALRCLPGAYGEAGNFNSLGSPTNTLVLKTSEQCLVIFANEHMLTKKPRYVVHFEKQSIFPFSLPATSENFSKLLQNAPKIVLTKVEVGVDNWMFVKWANSEMGVGYCLHCEIGSEWYRYRFSEIYFSAKSGCFNVHDSTRTTETTWQKDEFMIDFYLR